MTDRLHKGQSVWRNSIILSLEMRIKEMGRDEVREMKTEEERRDEMEER